MSVHKSIKRRTVPELMGYKNDKKIVALTAYTEPFAGLSEEALDMMLVGDSTAMVGYAIDDTLSITVEQMTAHGKAVVRSTQQACVVIDMPFGSFQESPEQAFRSASYMLAHSGAAAVKLEGVAALAETASLFVERGVAVLAHEIGRASC